MIDPGFCIRFCILQPRSVRTERHPSASVGWDRSYSFSLGLKGPSWSMVARSIETELSTSCSVGSDRAVFFMFGLQRPNEAHHSRSVETECSLLCASGLLLLLLLLAAEPWSTEDYARTTSGPIWHFIVFLSIL